MQTHLIIKEIGRGAKGARSLDQATAETLFGAMLDGEVPDVELGAIVLCLRIKGEDAEELAGFKRALDARTAKLTPPPGPRAVILPTYNGARKQPNLMPLVALLLAQRGVPTLIHGRHDFESRVDPFSLLEALDITPAATLDAAEGALATRRLACLRLETLCPTLPALLALRARLGVRNSAHTLAKLLDPIPAHSVRVVAVTHPEYFDRMTAQLEREHAWALLMRGTEGEAYAHPRRRPRMLGFNNGVTTEYFPQEEGDPCREPSGECSAAENAALIRAMLAGDTPIPQPILDQVQSLAHLAGA